jgi:hypothetical protein
MPRRELRGTNDFYTLIGQQPQEPDQWGARRIKAQSPTSGTKTDRDKGLPPANIAPQRVTGRARPEPSFRRTSAKDWKLAWPI